MGLTTYFFDTYAFIEAMGHNPNYLKMGTVDIVTTRLNLMELHYHILRTRGKDIARYYYNLFKKLAISIEDDVIQEANIFRLENKKKKLSYVDCIGYILARRAGVKFLTGDNAFKGVEGVEFLK
ncbi:PIN domain-containing protein [Candidatus Woesearchaeota archaeon]|nr:PIN domain-containing protein [Candidatus Woesearchaeota archaeon]